MTKTELLELLKQKAGSNFSQLVGFIEAVENLHDPVKEQEALNKLVAELNPTEEILSIVSAIMALDGCIACIWSVMVCDLALELIRQK